MTSDLLTLADYAAAASGRLEKGTLDFVEGGAGDEVTLRANREAFRAARLTPRVLRATSRPSTALSVLGTTWSMPIGIAPTAFHTLLDPAGEVATAEAAAAVGRVPFVVSTMSGRTLESIADAAAGRVPLWLQIYCFRDRGVNRALVERAVAAGFEALVLTVDAPRLGRRLRDLRSGFRLPPGVVAANLPDPRVRSPSAHAAAEFDPGLDWSEVAWLKAISSLPVLVKGVLAAPDADLAVTAGADGIIVSNHGGRQLDGVPATLEALPGVVSATAGRVPVLLDGGVRSGRDVLTALTLGADAVLLGRPILHGLAVAGAAGVTGVLDLVAGELREAMCLAGIPDPASARTGAPFRPRTGPAQLRLEELHAGLSDPLMDTMNFLNEITLQHPKAISFAPGRPFDGFFDVEDVFTHIRRYLGHLREQGLGEESVREAIFQYGPAAGQIRELVSRSLQQDEGIVVSPEAVVITVGAQEGMLLALRALVAGPRDVVLVSSPCYVGISGAARILDITALPVPEHPDGFRAQDVEAAVLAQRAAGRRVRAFYVIPDHSNPGGGTIGEQQRRELLDVAARQDFLILEDSPYRLVSTGSRLPTLKALDTGRRVIHLGSYSKTVFPGARIGFVVADQEWRDAAGHGGLLAGLLAKIKSMITVNTPSLSQAAVAGVLLAADGRLSETLRRQQEHYSGAMRGVLAELDRQVPPELRQELGVRWNRPEGGFFLSMTVPFEAGNEALARCAGAYGVLWTPMSYFYPGGGGENGIRLSVSYLSEDEILEGIGRLAAFVIAESRSAINGRAR